MHGYNTDESKITPDILSIYTIFFAVIPPAFFQIYKSDVGIWSFKGLQSD